ncbi:TraG family conjugative transposon ATPase [Pelobium manganitolerans]|uniref:TraG family conjugative transposon ATPase n=1 Tax=Pelobium manganitolerans TaxID=1842495 RepID=UPI003FA3BAE2
MQTIEKYFPIKDIENDFIISKQGDFTVAFELQLPEIFTLSDEDYENMHQAWIRALKCLPRHCVVHKQDWFEPAESHIKPKKHLSFLEDASQLHFAGRSYLKHTCRLFITKKVSHQYSSSLASNLIKPTLVPKECLKPKTSEHFMQCINQMCAVLQDCKLISLKRLSTGDLKSTSSKKGLIEKYIALNGSYEAKIFSDVEMGESLKIGAQHLKFFSLADATQMPHFCGPRITYDKFSTDKTKFPISFAGHLGLLLNCRHIYNQFIIIGDVPHTLSNFEKKRLRLQSLSSYSRENAVTGDATNEFLNEAVADQRQPVKAHFNIQIWADTEAELKRMNNLVSSTFAQIDAAAKNETVGAAQLWWSAIPGNEGDFPVNETFDTFLEQAVCFMNMESNYRNSTSPASVRFCDRIASVPVAVDLFDEPRKKGITSNMGTLVCGTSGGGKSMTVNHILHTLFTQGAHCVTVDIGGSYKGLCELVKGYYFTYTEENPISFNPFFVGEDEVWDTEKKESLKALLVALWKQEDDNFNRSEYVALSDALQGFYDNTKGNPKIFPCFNSFYDYLKSDFADRLATHKVKHSNFDLDNFLYVLRPYYRGGEFDYLLNATANLDLLNQPFIVIELDNIKDHPILFPVVTLIVMELFISKMRKLGKTKKVLTIDEAWKAIAKSGMANFLKYAFKTIRKFNGIPIVITQELDDLVSSPIIKDAIINNADIKILMDMRKYLNKFDELQNVLGLSDKAKTILLSVNKDKREIFIDLGGQESKVYRNELSPEEYYAFTTEGAERVQIAEYAERYGSVEEGIKFFIKDKKDDK